MAAEHHAILVIGSGFGGAVAAAKLTDAGFPVTMLERGPWRDTEATRAAGVERRAPLPAGRKFLSRITRRINAPCLPARGLNLHREGYLDIHYERDFTAVCSSNVGGGSHVYTAMNVKPDDSFWDGTHPQLSDAGMAAHYDWAMAMMGARIPPTEGVPNNIASDRAKPEWMITDDVPQPPVAFRFDRSYANNSYFGSRDNSKVTLDERLLLPAIAKGLVLRDRQEVIDIARCPRGYRVTAIDGHSGAHRTMTAARVILAAGALNTLKLLFASRSNGSLKGMAALGLGIGGNGDLIGYWPLNDKGRDYSLGTPCHGRFRLPGRGVQPLLTRFSFNGVDGIPMPGALRARLKRDVLLVGMGRDRANGVARWQDGRLKIAYSAEANPVLGELHDAYAEMSRRSGRKVYAFRNRTITVHALGGARVSADPAAGVVDGNGEVHGLPGLFVADGSALPGAPGVPPSMSIAAWSAHVATGLIG